MSARHMHVRSADRTLQDRPKALYPLNMMDAINPFLFRMIDSAVLIPVPRQFGIGFQFIGRNCRAFCHIRKNVWLQCCTSYIRNNAGHYVPFALQHTEHCRLSWSATTALAPAALASDHRLIGFNMSRQRRIAINKTKIFPNLMAHAPSGLVVHTKLALQFLRWYAMPRCSEQVHCIEPLLQWRVRVIERRANHRMDMVAAVLAGISWHLREFMEFANQAATLTTEICAVPQLEQVLKTSVIIWKHLHKFLDRNRLGHDCLRCWQSCKHRTLRMSTGQTPYFLLGRLRHRNSRSSNGDGLAPPPPGDERRENFLGGFFQTRTLQRDPALALFYSRTHK